MKIGMILPRLANGGGCYQLLHLARELVKKNHEVTIFAYYKPDAVFAKEYLEGLRIEHCGVEYKEDNSRLWQPIGLLKYYWHLGTVVWSLFTKLNQHAFDVLNPHEWLSDYAAVLYKWSHRNTKIVWMCNDVWHIPGNEEREEKRILFKLAHVWLMAPVDKWLVQSIDVIAVLDHRILSITKSFYKDAKVKVVRSGVDQSIFSTLPKKLEARKKLGLAADEYVVLCLSIFYHHRRFEDVIWAFELLLKRIKKKARLVIVGSDAYDRQYTQYIRQLVKKSEARINIAMVTDYISSQRKLNYLAAADVFVYPNERQTWGLIVIEAMLAGLPCIVSSGAGVHEIIEQGLTGFVYPVRRWKMLAKRLEFAIAHPEEMKRMAIRARKYVKNKLSWENYAQAMEGLFCS